jgi:hypothetical protein
VEIKLPVIRGLGTLKLKTVRLKETINGVSTAFGDAFRRLAPIPTDRKPDPRGEPATEYLMKNQVVVDWYPKIQAMKSEGVTGGDAEGMKKLAVLTTRHVAFLDLDAIYFELERYKAERGWYNLNITRGDIADLLGDVTWYKLLIPEEEMSFDSFERVRTWHDIAVALLRKYTERYYFFRKAEWEKPHLEYRDLTDDDPNFLSVKESPDESYYRILIDKSQEEIVAKLGELKAAIERGDLRAWDFQGIKAVWFGKHLYQPLLYCDTKIVEISPAPLNKGERLFVEDLKRFHDAQPEFFAARQMYLLRNLSKGKGVGFFEAGNFHPDFILWLLVDGRQHVVFVDPKGIRHLRPDNEKIRFHETIKEIETRLGDPAVTLDSFIVSNTSAATMQLHWNMDQAEMRRRNIVFQDESKTYVRSILEGVGA